MDTDERSTTMTDYNETTISRMPTPEIEVRLGEHLRDKELHKADMKASHETLGRLSAEQLDGREGADALRDLSLATGAHARIRLTIQRFERELRNRRLANAGSIDAIDGRFPTELVDDKIAKHNLPCGLDEAGDLPMAKLLWERAIQALETSQDDAPTQDEVAQRVADTYATLYYGAARPALKVGDLIILNERRYKIDTRRSSDPLGVGRTGGDYYILRNR